MDERREKIKNIVAHADKSIEFGLDVDYFTHDEATDKILALLSMSETLKWTYHSENVQGGIHDTVKWFNENRSGCEIVHMKYYPTKINELGFTESFTTIVWREKVKEE